MADYWMTFRLSSDGSDDQRRESIYKAIVKHYEAGWRWFEPTSFGLLQSDGDATSVVRTLSRSLLRDRDLLLVSDLRDPENSAYFGLLEYPDELKFFMPLVAKVT